MNRTRALSVRPLPIHIGLVLLVALAALLVAGCGRKKVTELENKVAQLEQEREEHEIHHVERTYGSFRRSVPLPCEIDPARVEASFRKGVLKVHLPKAESERTDVRRIPVRAD